MTATGKEAQIAEALFTRMAALVLTPTLLVAYPETAFTPPSSGKYLQVSHFTNRPRWEALAAGKLDQGLFQVTVVWPKNAGIFGPLQVVNAVMAHFPKGLILTNGATRVKVSAEPWAASPISEDSESRTPISIPWLA